MSLPSPPAIVPQQRALVHSAKKYRASKGCKGARHRGAGLTAGRGPWEGGDRDGCPARAEQGTQAVAWPAARQLGRHRRCHCRRCRRRARPPAAAPPPQTTAAHCSSRQGTPTTWALAGRAPVQSSIQRLVRIFGVKHTNNTATVMGFKLLHNCIMES